MQLLFTVSVAILSVAGASVITPCTVTAPANGNVGSCTSQLSPGAKCTPTCNAGYVVSGETECSAAGALTSATCEIRNQFKGNCVGSSEEVLYCQPTNGLKYPGGACSTGVAGSATRNTCVGEPCGSESCDPRTNLAGEKGAQFCCASTNTCVDWDAKGTNCKAAGPVNRVPKCNLIDAHTVDGGTAAGQASPSQTDVTASNLKYFQLLDHGYHFCPSTGQCEKLEIGSVQTAICPNWDAWVFRPATEAAANNDCSVGGDDKRCPSTSWVGGNIASFALGVKTSTKNPSVQCGGTSSYGGTSYGATSNAGTCDKAHLWYYRVEYPNGYEDEWEFCDGGVGATLAWDTQTASSR